MKTGWEDAAHKFDLELGRDFLQSWTSGTLASWSQEPAEPVLSLAACFETGKKWQQAVFFNSFKHAPNCSMERTWLLAWQ